MPASPAAILAERACIPRLSAFTAPSANTKVSRKFGNDTGRHGERRVCTPGNEHPHVLLSVPFWLMAAVQALEGTLVVTRRSHLG